MTPGGARMNMSPVPGRLFRRALSGVSMAAAAALLLLTGVGCPPRAQPVVEAPAATENVPTIRVLLASGDRIALGATGGYTILADGKVVASSMDSLAEGDLTRKGGTWSIHAARYPARELVVESVGRSYIRLGTKLYRGRMVMLPDGATGIIVVNHLDLESYLAGVLGKELYARWHDRTYQAQAIAARTYALYEMSTFGKGRSYDLRDDQSSQVYGGFSAETDKSWRAVQSTHGIVLAAGPKGAEKYFRAYYSSCCGGTVNNAHSLRGPPVAAGPLAGGQSCHDCSAARRYNWSAVTVPKAVIHSAVARTYKAAANLDGVKTIEVVSTFHGWLVWLDVVGPRGRKVRIRGQDLRLCLLRHGHPSAKGLYSTNCQVRDAGNSIVFENGRGFGHGVGMCQWGAEGKAQKGYTAKEILLEYYPGAKLFTAY